MIGQGRVWRLEWPLRAAWRCLRTWCERDRDRHYVAILDDSQLKDLALTRAELRAELSLPAWRKTRPE